MSSKWSKGVLMFTDLGIRLLGLRPDGRPWTKEEAFKYCNNPNKSEYDNEIRSNQLKLKSALYNANANNNRGKNWYKDINNFREVEISVDYIRR